MLATEQQHVFMWKGNQYEVVKVINGDYGDEIPVGVVIVANGGRVFILNRDYPELVDKDTCEVNASFKFHLFRIK